MQLPIVGQTLSITSIGHVLDLRTNDGYGLQIEGVAHIEFDGSTLPVVFTPDIDVGVEVSRLLGDTVVTSTAHAGTLSIGLSSGAILTVEPDADVEAWNLTGPKGYRVVCLPGGALSTWSAH